MRDMRMVSHNGMMHVNTHNFLTHVYIHIFHCVQAKFTLWVAGAEVGHCPRQKYTI
jgi:hypothetical protein